MRAHARLAAAAPTQVVEQCRAERPFEPTSVPDQIVVIGEVGVRLRSNYRCKVLDLRERVLEVDHRQHLGERGCLGSR